MTPIRATPRNIALAVLACVAVAIGAPAAPPPGRAPAVQAVVDCRKVDDSTQRLACYDKAVDGVVQAETSGDLVTIDREQRRAVRHQAFGLTLPSLAMFDRGEKSEDVDNITATVASASQDPYGKWTIRLDDGATWRQIDSEELTQPAHHGSTVKIRKAMLGSFFMNVDGQLAIRVRRDN